LQVFDDKVTPLRRDEYRIHEATRVTANTIEDLARRMGDVDPGGFIATVEEFNQAVEMSVPFNPNVLDGRRSLGIDPPKSNWANTIETPPFTAYAVTCGITFTFGGLRIDTSAHVLDVGGSPIFGLFGSGELTAGIFYFNYPGGSGLTSGSVFGRITGRETGRLASQG
jgi:tricarballylate dehydrogenase